MPTCLLISLALLVSLTHDSSVCAILTSKRIQHRACFKATLKCDARPRPISRMRHVASESGRANGVSSSRLFAGTPGIDASAVNRPPLLPNKVAPWIRTLAIFFLGYGIGGASAPGWQRQAKFARKIGATQIALAALLLRDAWRSTPAWVKPRIARYRTRVVRSIRARFTKNAKVSDAGMEEDLDDITDFSNFATKIQDLINVAKVKLDLEDGDTGKEGEGRDDFNVRASLLALLKLLGQIKSRSASARDQIYRSSGSAVPAEVLEGMDHLFELADLAYDEHKDGDIKQVLKGMGYDLIKHDTTAIPGYLGYYVALNTDPSKGKTAIIGVKGTSTLEDLFTDSCASAVSYTLAKPFYEGGGNSLRCHEGVFISSERLAKDILPLVQNLLIPSGYRIVITGHSLGAGCASLLGLLLRTSIPSLQDSNNLKVWAFASPPVLDIDSARACSPFVTTVVNNCDVVTRSNISPLAVTVSLMRAVNKRLQEQGLGMSDFQSTLAFLNKIREGTAGEMLMSADEVVSEINSALEREDLKDPDHLYVPGKVVLMYDLWEKEMGKEENRESEQEFTNFLSDWMPRLQDTGLHSRNVVKLEQPTSAEEAVLCMDGTCKALRFIELDGRLLDDHMSPQYRSSIANILSSRNELAKEVTGSIKEEV